MAARQQPGVQPLPQPLLQPLPGSQQQQLQPQMMANLMQPALGATQAALAAAACVSHPFQAAQQHQAAWQHLPAAARAHAGGTTAAGAAAVQQEQQVLPQNHFFAPVYSGSTPAAAAAPAGSGAQQVQGVAGQDALAAADQQRLWSGQAAPDAAQPQLQSIEGPAGSGNTSRNASAAGGPEPLGGCIIRRTTSTSTTTTTTITTSTSTTLAAGIGGQQVPDLAAAEAGLPPPHLSFLSVDGGSSQPSSAAGAGAGIVFLAPAAGEAQLQEQQLLCWQLHQAKPLERFHQADQRLQEHRQQQQLAAAAPGAWAGSVGADAAAVAAARDSLPHSNLLQATSAVAAAAAGVSSGIPGAAIPALPQAHAGHLQLPKMGPAGLESSSSVSAVSASLAAFGSSVFSPGEASSGAFSPAAGSFNAFGVLDSPGSPAAVGAAGLTAFSSSSDSSVGLVGAGNGPQQPASSGPPGGGFLSGFVSLAMYQEQMQGVASLHGQVGQLVAQLREAHADVDGATQQLQQERQEAASRTGALRGALQQLHGTMEALRCDHEALQEAHAALVAKDLMRSGLLKDRYVADLFSRLQEAEWKLATARRRAATWGFHMLVPHGRADRGIQTQYAEVWAAEQQQQQQQLVQLQQQPREGAQKQARHAGGDAGAVVSLTEDVAAGMSASTEGSSSSRAPVPRKQPAFTQHGAASSRGNSSSSTSSKLGPVVTRSSSDAGAAAAAAAAATAAGLLAAAELALAPGSPPVALLSSPGLLQLIATLYSTKAAADAAAMRAHSAPLSLWDFVLRQLALKEQQDGSGGDASSSSRARCERSGAAAPPGTAVVAGLAQLLGSIRLHAPAVREVALFERALLGSRPVQQAAAAASASGSRPGSSSSGSSSAVGSPRSPSSGGCRSGVIKGSWGEVSLDSGKLQLPRLREAVLLPTGVQQLLRQVLCWPGMAALLSWVREGHFLSGLREGDLGKILMDVQAPHVHFLLLEAADILSLHPLPRVQVVQAAAPYVRLLQLHSVPTKGAGSSSAGGSSQQGRRCESLLVVSSAALQLLKPAELQAAMAAALVPVLLASGDEASDDGGGAAAALSDTPSLQQQQPGFADLATLASLLALQPALLMSHLPPEMHAMGGCLAAALLAAERLVAVVGDRGCLLVSQSLQVALAALLHTSKGAAGGSGNSSGSCSSSSLVQQWLLRVQESSTEGAERMPELQQLLPDHELLAVVGVSGSRRSRQKGAVAAEPLQLDDDQVLLMRVRALADWGCSDQYQQLMRDAQPLRKVMLPGARSNRLPSA